MSGWSNITFPEDVYRWLLSIDILENKGMLYHSSSGQVNQKAFVTIPYEDGFNFQNGYNIAAIIKILLLKNGQSASDSLKNVKAENSKQTKTTNWNFIWLSFDDLRMQFDNRIKELILNGEYALITEIVKQLYEKDDNKNQAQMKKIVLKQKVQEKKQTKQAQMNSSKKDGNKAKQKEQPNGALDIKKVNTSKSPDESESSLQFFILLLTQSLGMSVEQVLGLFTNQNKYLAHIVVKGVNESFEGVKLFYTLLSKHHKKLRQFIEADPKDAQSCLYAIKPGFISKDEKIAELTIELFLKLGNVYEWFVSDAGKGSTTLFLGMKRHPHFLDLYFDLLMTIVLNEEADYFTTHFKPSFRDSSEMIEACSFIMGPLANSFFKQKLFELGILDEWIQIAMKLFDQNLEGKIMALKFVGEVMNYLPEAIQQNQDHLAIFKHNWKDFKMVDYIHLIDQVILIFQRLAGEKNEMAKKMYQIIIEILDAIYDQFDKKEYLLAQFIQILPQFPSVPIHYMVEVFKEQKLSNYEIQLIDAAANLSNDPVCLMKIGQTCLGYFVEDSLHHAFFAKILYKICQKTFDSEQGKSLILKCIKGCLQSFCNAEIQKKNPKKVIQQPLYGIKKANLQKVSEEETHDYLCKQKMQATWISLVDKLSELVIDNTNEELEKSIKEELLESNSFVKKNRFKVGSKEISQILNKRFGVNKEEELDHDQDYYNRKSMDMIDESSMRKKGSQTINMSRYVNNGPPTLRKEFAEVIEKKKRQQEEKKFEQDRKAREEVYKKTLVKKELQKINLLRGFAQEAQIKEDGFWQKFNKQQSKQLQLYPPQLMQPKDIEIMQNLFKKYHRLLRYLFLKYTSSMYTTRQSTSFNESKQRKETISVVELIKFLKEYKLYFLTSNNQVQNLVRDINVKLLNKRETQELDFLGFEQFLIQFCAVIFTKPHTITAKSAKGEENIKKKLLHLSHSEVVAQWFDYLRTVFIQKGQKTAIFDEPEAAYFNETQVIKEFNRKLQEDPNFILPEGYKKVTDKLLIPEAKVSNNISKFKESLIDVYEVLDEIMYENLGFHIMESIIKKETKVRVKPHAFVNVKAKLLDVITESKPRASSSVIERKTAAIPPVKMLEKKTLTFGMKLGLSYISYKDKLLGEQVAYVIDDMLDAVEKGRNTIEKEKIINEVVKAKMEKEEQKARDEEQRIRKLKQRKNELQKMKKQFEEKKEKENEEKKQEREKEQKKKEEREKRIKEKQDKYLQEQKQKMREKKQKQEQQAKKKLQETKKKKDQSKKTKQKFQDFNTKQITKFKEKLSTETEKKKKQEEEQKADQKKKQELYKKLRQKISEKDKKAIEIKQKTNEEIMELYNSQQIKQVYQEFEPALKALFDFLMQNTYVSLTQKKLKNELILETWHYFNLVFQLSPLIISAKEIFSIFRTLTKQKQISADYHTGLSFEEFKQALLRIAIRHKTVFSKIAEKIKQDDMTDKEINDVINKDIEEKEKNQFDEPSQIDVKSLLKEEDIKKEFWNHYGDISKVNDRTLKGLIYYLKVPRDKQGQQERWREIVASKVKYNAKQTQQLKERLNQEYSLKKQEREREKERIRKRLAASQNMNSSMIGSTVMDKSKLQTQLAKLQGEEANE